MSDAIDRQAAIASAISGRIRTLPTSEDGEDWIRTSEVRESLLNLPSVRSEIIRCKDCRWWDKYGDYDNGYCMAAKHGYWSEHWEISIRRQYKGDFYCADAEPKGEQE
jgi:hypothetical protein